MRLRRLIVATTLGALSLVALPRNAGAQGSVVISPSSNIVFPAAPEIVVQVTNLPPNTSARLIRLRLALDIGLGLVLYDSTKDVSTPSFRMIKLLPENRDIFAEVTVLDVAGQTILSTLQFVGHTGLRLELLTPNAVTGNSLQTRRPTFSWRSAKVTAPPGPWVYELSITETATQVTRTTPGITDTSFTYPVDLEASTSYRWSVKARLANGLAVDSAVASSVSTFTILPSDAVVKTLLYQNFPNPFPAPTSATTCFWFDLKNKSHVELTVHDLRGHRVRTMIPGQLPSELNAGRYGRASEIIGKGCDPRLQWDGTADNGRVVPAGVYLLRFTADGQAETMKKILFLGH